MAMSVRMWSSTVLITLMTVISPDLDAVTKGHYSSSLPTEDNDKILVMIYHDESIFNTNDMRHRHGCGVGFSWQASYSPKNEEVRDNGQWFRWWTSWLFKTLTREARFIDPDFPCEARELFKWSSEGRILDWCKVYGSAIQIAKYKYSPAMHTTRV